MKSRSCVTRALRMIQRTRRLMTPCNQNHARGSSAIKIQKAQKACDDKNESCVDLFDGIQSSDQSKQKQSPLPSLVLPNDGQYQKLNTTSSNTISRINSTILDTRATTLSIGDRQERKLTKQESARTMNCLKVLRRKIKK